MNAENRKGGVTVQCKWLNSDMMLENLKLVACFQGAFQPAAISQTYRFRPQIRGVS